MIAQDHPQCLLLVKNSPLIPSSGLFCPTTLFFEHIKIAKCNLLGRNDGLNTRICHISQIDFSHRRPVVDIKKRVIGIARMTAQLDNFPLRKGLKKTEEGLNRLIMIEFIEGYRMP